MKVIRTVGGKVKRTIKSIPHLPEFFRRGGAIYVTIEQHDDRKLLEGRSILVAGGSGIGIGRIVARKCLENGANVLITGRDKEKLKAAEQELGGKIHALAFDISDISKLKENITLAAEMLDGHIDGFVNCAGIGVWKSEYTEDDWNRIYDIHVKACYFATREVINHMKANQIAGSVVLISSNDSIMSQTQPYASAKAAVSHMVRGFARENMPCSIRCNGIAPGETISNLAPITASFQSDGNLFWRENIHIFLPEEQAETIVFLLGDNSSAINGQVIVTDGGYTLDFLV